MKEPDAQVGFSPDSAPPGAPEPHPIDFEWRFTADDAEALAAEIASYPGRIACLGTPGVFWRLAQRGREIVLYDRNPRMKRCLEPSLRDSSGYVETIDLNTSCPMSSGFDIILMDPPWYLDQYEVWVGHVRRMAKPGGRVLTSLFPPMLRPGAPQQRQFVEKLLTQLGAIDHRRPVLYATPRFEQEVLEAAGLSELGHWRVGEILRLQVGAMPARRASPVRLIEPQWLRFQLGRRVVAVRSDPADYGTVRLSPVGPEADFRLHSVSSRVPHRSAINVWTSRNRVANATGIQRVIEFLYALESGADPGTLVVEARDNDRDGLMALLALIAA